MARFRTEKDALGSRKVPSEAYYGIEALRAAENFPISGLHPHPYLIRAYALIKQAAALANMETGRLDRKIGKVIVKAAEEVAAGKHAGQFIVDAYQAGAGTSTNMNLNEVIANRALEMLRKPKGRYDIISPHDHVNMSQSTNDTYPTALYIASIWLARELGERLEELAKAFEAKSRQFAAVVKPGRTHLMDALPITLGQEFSGYAAACRKNVRRVVGKAYALAELPIGGTAVGTGLNAGPRYQKAVIRHLRRLTGLPLRKAGNLFERLQSAADVAAFSASLKSLCTDLIRIANDIRLMASGPLAGLGEISLPPVQPGSSIMPGKVNPSMAEMLNMVCFQVIGNDIACTLAAQAGQLELNVFMPVIAHNLLHSLEILKNAIAAFTAGCVAGIEANRKRCGELAASSPAMATVLAPKIGYYQSARLAAECLKTGKTISQLALEKGLITEKEARAFRDLLALTKPGIPGRRAK